MPIEWRGIAPDKELGWKANIVRENTLKLVWFRKNQKRLDEIANVELKKTVPPEDKEALEDNLVENALNREFKPRRKFGEPEPPDLKAMHHTMRPVEPEHLKLIKEADGRRRYLKQRMLILPEKRYYLPENVNATYGWKMFKHRRTNYGFGRWSVIKESFYRRQGVHMDPEWYREPATYSPSICTR